MRLQAEQMGRSLLDWLRNLQQASAAHCIAAAPTTPHLPAGHGAGLVPWRQRCTTALQAYAFGWAENMTQAALKSVPLGQSAGQRMLARLAREIPAAVHTAMQPE